MYFQSHVDDTTLSKDDNMRLNPNLESPNAPSINGETMYAGTGIGPGLPESATELQYGYGDYDDPQETDR